MKLFYALTTAALIFSASAFATDPVIWPMSPQGGTLHSSTALETTIRHG